MRKRFSDRLYSLDRDRVVQLDGRRRHHCVQADDVIGLNEMGHKDRTHEDRHGSQQRRCLSRFLRVLGSMTHADDESDGIRAHRNRQAMSSVVRLPQILTRSM